MAAVVVVVVVVVAVVVGLANHTGVSLLLTIERSLNRSCD